MTSIPSVVIKVLKKVPKLLQDQRILEKIGEETANYLLGRFAPPRETAEALERRQARANRPERMR